MLTSWRVAVQAPWKYRHHKYIINTKIPTWCWGWQKNKEWNNLLLSTMSVTLTLQFCIKWEFGKTQPKVNFASNWLSIRIRVMLGASSQETIERERGRGQRKWHRCHLWGDCLYGTLSYLNLTVSKLCVVGASGEGSRKMVGCIAGIRTKDWPVVYRHYKTCGWSSTMWTDEDTGIDMEPGTETPRTSNIWPAGRSLVQVALWIWLILVSCSFIVDMSLITS